MANLPKDLYARWRSASPNVSAFEERTGGASVNERLLQLVWHYQRLLRDRLLTTDGRSVRVLHPGFWNREAGPDFRGAVLQIGDEPARSGDVEIDLAPGGWRGHSHDENPAYRNVILHAVWETGTEVSTKPLATLPLKPFLDSPISDLKTWLSRNSLRKFSGPLLGQCSAPLRDLSVSMLLELLDQAAQIRLQAKATQMEARSRQAGWEQALWEGLFGALGYKHNVWPMRRLAELAPTLRSKEFAADSAFDLQVRLIGVGGLLPTQLNGLAAIDQYVRRLWDVWWRSREQYSESILPRALWRLNGLRPANHPQRRLALASHWLTNSQFLPRLENWFAAGHADNELAPSLLETLQVANDDFWSWHWTFRSHRMAKAQPLLGPQRATDLAVNVILPWFWMRAVAGKNETAQQIAEHRYFAWPKAEDNAVLRLARQRLFGGRVVPKLTTAASQQGLLQIAHDFCEQSNALCDDCQFPSLVRQLG